VRSTEAVDVAERFDAEVVRARHSRVAAVWSESPQQFGKFTYAETAKWAKVVQEAGIEKH
jgi:hypothetical protein